MKTKTAIVIGATSGIGRELAVRLLEDGWRVGIAGRREALLADMQGKYGAEAVSYAVLDVTEEKATEALDSLLADVGAPDLFLHVAGVGYQNPSVDERIELDVVRTNCEGMVRVVSHFVNYVKASPAYDRNRRAQVGVVTSVAATAGLGVAAAYSASKKMQVTYLSALSQLARMRDIPVFFSDIRPGFVATDLLELGHHYPVLMTVEAAAGHILRGLRRRRRVIIFDWRFRLVVALWNLIPRGLWERITFIKTQ